MISSNPSDEATSESEPESSAQSVGVDPAPRPTRRSFTAAYKAEIVAEYEGAPHGEEVRGAAQGGTLPLPHQLPPRLGRRTYGSVRGQPQLVPRMASSSARAADAPYLSARRKVASAE